MSAVLSHGRDRRLILAVDVDRSTDIPDILKEADAMTPAPSLFYALESLPHLLGRGDLILLTHALRNAIEDAGETMRRPGESDGDYIARLVRRAAEYKFGKAA